jgi:hypothetical protein
MANRTDYHYLLSHSTNLYYLVSVLIGGLLAVAAGRVSMLFN